MTTLSMTEQSTTDIKFNLRPVMWKPFLLLGISLIVLGMLALFYPVATSMAAAVLFGVVLLLSGIAQLVYLGYDLAPRKGRIAQGLISVFSFIGGVIAIRNPIAGAAGLTVTLTFFLFVSAVGKFMLARDLRPQNGWGWLLLSSLISFGLGVYLLMIFPEASIFVPGVFLGVDMIFYGVASIAFALAVRSRQKGIPEHQTSRVEGRAA